MSLPAFSIKKKVTVYMMTALLFLLGIIAYKRLPQELFPPITFPQVTIVTDYFLLPAAGHSGFGF